jgi:hypothetical protein
MGDAVLVLIIVIGAALFFWLRLQAPKARETRLERERRVAAAQAEREAEEARLVVERDALLRTILWRNARGYAVSDGSCAATFISAVAIAPTILLWL